MFFYMMNSLILNYKKTLWIGKNITLDVMSLHQDMIKACDEHDMTTLHFYFLILS